MADPIRMGVIGIDHRHIYTMVSHMREAGAELIGWCTEGEPDTIEGFLKRFPGAPRVADPGILLTDPTIDVILTAAIPCASVNWKLRHCRPWRACGANVGACSPRPYCTVRWV